MALQREDRNVCDDDDEHGEQRRSSDLFSRLENGPPGRFNRIASGRRIATARAPLRERPVDVLDDDDGAVDDDAEVHRAEREQVGGDSAEPEADERGEQRQRNHSRDDRRRASASQKYVQHDRHEQRALEQVPEHRRQRGRDEPRAVVVRNDANAARQHGRVQVRNPLLYIGEDDRRVLAFPHQHDSLDDLVIVVAADEPLARHRADLHVRNVADEKRRARVL